MGIPLIELRETLEITVLSRETGAVTTGQNWGVGRQPVGIRGLRADHLQEAHHAVEVTDVDGRGGPLAGADHHHRAPHYPMTNRKAGRPPYSLATMLRIHLMQ